jgi:hypothetical protein
LLIFGNSLAMYSFMTTKDEEEEEEWRKLCQPLADEQDPLRLSKLVDQLIEKLDARRLLRQRKTTQGSTSGSATDDN